MERWFGYLTAQRIRRGVHKSVQALEADIRDWIKNWNANPRPFAWTKTADEILDSLANIYPGFQARDTNCTSIAPPPEPGDLVVRRYQRGRSAPFRSESSQDSCTSLLTCLPDQHGHRALSASVLVGLWHEHELSHGCGLLQQLMRAARLAERQPFGDDRVDLVRAEQLQ